MQNPFPDFRFLLLYIQPKNNLHSTPTCSSHHPKSPCSEVFQVTIFFHLVQINLFIHQSFHLFNHLPMCFNIPLLIPFPFQNISTMSFYQPPSNTNNNHINDQIEAFRASISSTSTMNTLLVSLDFPKVAVPFPFLNFIFLSRKFHQTHSPLVIVYISSSSLVISTKFLLRALTLHQKKFEIQKLDVQLISSFNGHIQL